MELWEVGRELGWGLVPVARLELVLEVGRNVVDYLDQGKYLDIGMQILENLLTVRHVEIIG
jgi:hypothetical protein